MSSPNCCFQACIQVCQEAGQVVWYSHLLKNFPHLIVIHTVTGSGIVNKAEIDSFLYFFFKLSCFYHDPADVGNLISGSSAFSKTSLNIWKFTVHVLENFEHYFASVWNVCNRVTVWTLFDIASLGLEWKLTFSRPIATAVFSIFADIWRASFSQHHPLGFEIAQPGIYHLH